MTRSESLEKKFWQEFVHTTWEKQSTHSTFTLPVTEADIFQAMLHAATEEQEKEQCSFIDPYRVAVDGCHVLDLETFAAFLPMPEDEDLDGYMARMDAQCDLDMSIQVTKISRYAPGIWDAVRKFLHPFFEAVDMVPETIEVDLFVGKYAQTHFGVHRDADSTFTFGLRGAKQFCLWPLQTFTSEMTIEGWPTHVQDAYYQKFRPQADVVTMNPGTLLYWPSSVWHVGESPNSWSITLAVALHLVPDPYERIKAVMSALLPSPPQGINPNAYPCTTAQRNRETPALADNLSQALADIRQAMSDPAIDRQICLEWLKQVSGCGLTATPPPVDNSPLQPGQTVRIDPRFPILWQTFPPDYLAISANGYGQIFQMAGTEPLIALLRDLNQGEAVTIPSSLDPNLRTIMDELARWMAFLSSV